MQGFWIGDWGLGIGHRALGIGHRGRLGIIALGITQKLKIFPMPHALCPMPHAQHLTPTP
jgi:hypothetical protein